ncbi:MAG TPA: hypothetical protein VHA77_12330 [Xanthobacteraceae bacterium]|jgi:hypothetical protein|nr:hypothetical protein [Xanthobacteraceae bacterium]
MTNIRPVRPDDDGDTAATEFEGEIREFIRRDVASLRKVPEANDFAGSNVGTLIQRVSGTTVSEIENLILELQGMQDSLRNEGERVQREIAGYVHLSQAANSSIKAISDGVSQWKAAKGNVENDWR